MWAQVKNIITTLLIKSYKLNEFNQPLSEGLIVFLHKPGKSPQEIKSWRPLTLLNSIFKIASGVLAQRLKKLINTVVHKHQYCFITGKNASDMIEMLKKIMKEEEGTDEKTVLLALDFKGAFDTVKHEAIIRALKMKGFGTKFIEWVAALLSKNESKLVINGRTTDDTRVKIKRSARQGDPLSPYLFILVFDELLERMDEDDDLRGVEINKEKISTLAFADDNYTAKKDTVEGIRRKILKIKRLMNKFKMTTGLTINVAKSEILVNNKEMTENLKEIESIELKNNIISLGVPIGIETSIENKIADKLSSAIRHWSKMNLNMVERIEVWNVLILPKVLHLLKHLEYNKLNCDRWTKMAREFIWKSKRNSIKYVIIEDEWSN